MTSAPSLGCKSIGNLDTIKVVLKDVPSDGMDHINLLMVALMFSNFDLHLHDSVRVLKIESCVGLRVYCVLMFFMIIEWRKIGTLLLRFFDNQNTCQFFNLFLRR